MKLTDLNRHRIADIFGGNSLTAKLQSGKQLTVKSGIDPTTTNLHLGHLVGLLVLKEFIEHGHRVVFVMGDFTAQLGNGVERPQLSLQQTKENSQELVDFLTRFFDSENFVIRRQSEWFENMSLEQVLGFFSQTQLRKLLSHDVSKEKLHEGVDLRMHEFIYPIIMAIDSVVLKPDIELGSLEQKFNLELCRDLMKANGVAPEDVIINARLGGIDGSEKMSKSQRNFIGLFDVPEEQVLKILAIRNDVAFTFLRLLTDLPDKKIDELETANDWMEAKRHLVVGLLGSINPDVHYEKLWEQVSQTQTKDFSITQPIRGPSSNTIIDLLSTQNIADSNRQAKRLVAAGAIRLNGEPIVLDGLAKPLRPGDELRIGKKIYKRVD